MTHRLVVAASVDDARARGYLHTLQSRFPKAKLTAVSTAAIYTIDAKLSAKELQKAASALTNPLIERVSTGAISYPSGVRFAIEIGFLPGVTDNVGKTAQETIQDAIGKKFAADEHVYTSTILFLSGKLTPKEVEAMTRELHNPLIERASVFPAGERIPVLVPKVALHESARVDEVDLNVSDAELARISKEGIAGRGPLALPLASMKAIRKHFSQLKRNPTDIELESLAQTWSEHCKHTIFNDPLDEIKQGIYRRYIKGATQKIRKQKGSKDFCVSVFKDNSGAIAFDKDFLITHKVETHNSPSGLDPFGGSVTAIGGVNRDALGFGLGAKPIANTYGFCVADPNDARELFRDAKKKQPLLPARRILEGVVRGINVGGNQSGIPTPLGFVAVDPSYRGKPLVYGGTVGLIPRKLGSPSTGSGQARKSYEKKARAGDLIVMIGGKVGIDGIHGATFSSDSLSAGSPATAVQIGDPITQKKFSDALIREARDANLYSSITDDGAGGLSGSIGEMARESGGCEVDLEKVPLKYPGLAPWQIWLSESQERMTLAVPQKNWATLKKIFDRHDVEATVIGRFTKSGRCLVRFNRREVMNISLEFLHEGRPIEAQKTKKVVSKRVESKARTVDVSKALLQLLAQPSIGSTAFIAQQYDHEVQASSVIKPLQGRGRVNADAAVLRPLPHSKKGVVLAHGYTPWYSQLDTYAMAASAIDTAVRNAVCVGGSRDSLAILDNFCWSSSQSPERLYELKLAAKACYDIAVAYGTPFISGKDSMFNDFRGFDANGKAVHIAALPTLLISAIGVMPDIAHAQTIDFKRVGDVVYLIGETHDELGASAFLALRGEIGANVPAVNAKKNAKAYDAVSAAMQQGLVASAIGLSRGGLGVALAKSAIAGKLGAEVDLSHIRGTAKNDASILFSESQGRMLVSVSRDTQQAFEKQFRGVALTQVGEVVQAASLSIKLPRSNLGYSLTELTDAYRSFFQNW
ncbi:MAG TPA: AIR synthase-related protein [Candidatus Paceibacterota bacterium]|nr:AIR synthase-related protein [Candidatus Paceibacterota bacterium]